MIKIFTGEDRIKAKNAISQFLGPDYEVIDCAELTPGDLPTIFLGGSLFATTRNILLRDFTANKSVYEHLSEYLNTPHNIALFETKLDKRSVTYKQIKDQVEIQEFPLAKNQNFGLVFDIYRTAKRDGRRAVSDLAKIKPEQDPIMFFGLLVSQATKDFTATKGQGIKERKILKELARIDLQMKTTGVDPWLIIESFLIRLSSF
ncbi:hypothetical protein IKE19_00625 [Candidatus Saccharibacteria bacterium]|nr:hypothetical protein [Candidatus Saccharibacteria bacterium]